MALTPKSLSRNQLTASAVTQYTVPGSTTTRVTELLITNTDTIQHTITVHFVPSGGSADATNQVLPATPVEASEALIVPLNTILAAGDFIAALASVASQVNLLISGWEMT